MTVSITWIDPDGAETPLEVDEDRLVLPGFGGHRAPPVALTEIETPGRDGSVVRSVRTGVREVHIPLLVWQTDTAFLDDRMAELAFALDPTRGAGQLRVERDDGSFRALECRYAGGLEGTENEPGHDSVVLVFRAHDPYWADLDDVEVEIEQAPGGTFFPFFPLQLLSSELFADVEVTNEGDVETWPVWTITGPGNAPVIRNLTSGSALAFSDLELADGEELAIDTRPGRKTVMLEGATAFGRLDASSSLFPLGVGVETIRVELSAATVATAVLLAFRQRYRGA